MLSDTADRRGIKGCISLGKWGKICQHLHSTSRNLSSEKNGKNKKGNDVYYRAVYDSKKLETSLMYTN